MLTDVEIRYTDFEQIELALKMVVKKLHPYFQAHIIIVLTSYQIKSILHKLAASGRFLKWAIELSEFDFIYHPRSAVKGQVLTNFIAEMSNIRPRDISEPLWILETDDSSKATGGGAGMVLISLEGLSIAQSVKFLFAISNNEFEYKFVLLVLQVAKELSVMNLELRCDSQLVASQLHGEYEAKNDRMTQYLTLARFLVVGFVKFIIAQVSRSKN